MHVGQLVEHLHRQIMSPLVLLCRVLSGMDRFLQSLVYFSYLSMRHQPRFARTAQTVPSTLVCTSDVPILPEVRLANLVPSPGSWLLTRLGTSTTAVSVVF